MTKYDVSGLLNTYASIAKFARDDEHLKEIIRNLKSELDLRKIEKFNEKKNKRI